MNGQSPTERGMCVCVCVCVCVTEPAPPSRPALDATSASGTQTKTSLETADPIVKQALLHHARYGK